MSVMERLKRILADKRAVRELGLLDDRTLHDPGISRSHIPYAVRSRNGL
jgi:uncharacterized protein YjiS (DUF1127 family)